MLSKDLLDLLCCPHCHGDLVYEPEEGVPNPRNGTLTCKACGRVYQVKDDIPIMITDEEEKPSS